MLTGLKIKNFKRLPAADIELGETVVFIGPNNSGKTTALQALALWDIGLRRWNEKRAGTKAPEKRPGVTVNRRDLISLPVPRANLIWRNLHTRSVQKQDGRPQTKNVLVEVVVDGITKGREWSCGLEFDYANEESFYCRPLRLTADGKGERMPVPPEAAKTRVAFLPPMSGLAAVEEKHEPGRIDVLIGEGQTAQVLRNLCWRIYSEPTLFGGCWKKLAEDIKNLFGVELQPPKFIVERGEVVMSYRENGVLLDLSSSGRGLQQTLLLLAYLYANPDSVLLLDEPDAHLEVIRQRQIYRIIHEIAEQQNSQIIAASHSEVVLNEAAEKDVVVAFVGKPHRMPPKASLKPKTSQVLKALKEIGFEQYLQAEQKGWVLYLEGSTDLAILQAFAKTLRHPAAGYLDAPFVHYVGNSPSEAERHFFGLREAKKDLKGIAVFDRLDKELKQDSPLNEIMWERREIENYLCSEEVLLAYAGSGEAEDLFGSAKVKAMREAVAEISTALKTLGDPEPWSPDIKATDKFLDPLFDKYFEKLNLPNALRKTNYHVLAAFVPRDKIAPEVTEKLAAIVEVAAAAEPCRED